MRYTKFFLNYVDKKEGIRRMRDAAQPIPECGCLIWERWSSARGSASILYRGKGQRVARVMYQLAIGDIPDGKEVCHRCDIPLCIEPSHLFLATHRENMRDGVLKGRVGGNDRRIPHDKLVGAINAHGVGADGYDTPARYNNS